LLKTALAALLAFGWCGRPEIPFSTTDAFAARTRCPEAAGSRSAEAPSAGAWTTETAWSAWTRATITARARCAARTRRPRTAKSTAARSRSAKPTAGPWRSAGSAILPRARFADSKRPTHEQLPVKLLNRCFGCLAIRVFDKRKPACAASFAVEWPHDLRRFADGGKVRPQVVFRGLIREIAYEQSDGWHGIVEEGRVRLVRSGQHNKNAITCQARPSKHPVSDGASRDALDGTRPPVRPVHRPGPAPMSRVAGPCHALRAKGRGALVSRTARPLAETRPICSPNRVP
jgi:hypothetical protein